MVLTRFYHIYNPGFPGNTRRMECINAPLMARVEILSLKLIVPTCEIYYNLL